MYRSRTDRLSLSLSFSVYFLPLFQLIPDRVKYACPVYIFLLYLDGRQTAACFFRCGREVSKATTTTTTTNVAAVLFKGGGIVIKLTI